MNEGDATSHGETLYPGYRDEQFHFCVVNKRLGINKCAMARNIPLWACDRIAKEICSLLILLGKLTIGECERIHQTSVQLNYARHVLRSLTLWLLTLPFVLVKDFGLLTGPVCGVTAWLLFGVHQTGHSIEDPFQKTLRLSILCKAIRRDVLGEAEYRNSVFNLEESENIRTNHDIKKSLNYVASETSNEPIVTTPKIDFEV